LDRIDLHIEVPALKWKEMSGTEPGEPSSAIRERICRAREIQQKRFSEEGLHCNAQMATQQLGNLGKTRKNVREKNRMKY